LEHTQFGRWDVRASRPRGQKIYRPLLLGILWILSRFIRFSIIPVANLFPRRIPLSACFAVAVPEISTIVVVPTIFVIVALGVPMIAIALGTPVIIVVPGIPMIAVML